MYKRFLNLKPTLVRKSILLLGPRQTGKSTWLRALFPEAFYIDLLQPRLFQELQRDPGRLGEIISFESKSHSHFIIDEIQSLPILLNEVHRQIEKNKRLRFILTGSSARKLKRAGGNLLGGRLAKFQFHPLIEPEVNAKVDAPLEAVSWEKRLQIGALPSILTSTDAFSDLSDYVGTYLKEEIQAEGLARSLDNFSRFLEVAALCQGEQVNFTQVGSDAQVPSRTVVDYFSVLTDTLVGHLLPAFLETKKRKAMTTAKFYFFDIGVGNALLRRREIAPESSDYGKVLEQLIYLELLAYRDYVDPEIEIFYWRSLSKFEVDFVVRKQKKLYGIEVKAKRNPNQRDYKGLLALEEDFPKISKTCICRAPMARRSADNVDILPVQRFLTDLWAGRFFE